ncbi:PREDICTED: F-box protein SKIP5 [Tarenaya hassleriana]|uniref:F-box protein SKIP5 n=1 Tax=Tarenaya hassleriana TaxID=28532 RepID=UPI00053C4698|nr:PREDICTED: F-box protein SKIP5 [Tarenaya hassleriana]
MEMEKFAGIGNEVSSIEFAEPRKKQKMESDPLFNNLDDGCLMHIFSFLSPIPDRYNTALVCHRWHYLACHPRLWLRVDRSVKDLSQPGVFPNIESAVSAARPGDTILIGAGGSHRVSNIQIKKPLCLIGGGELPDETTLICSRGSDSALELLSTCKLANLTVKAELGCCLLHRSGRLTIDGCVLQCESNPLDYLSCPIVTTAGKENILVAPAVKAQPENGTVVEKTRGDSVSVLQTRIEGGAKAVLTNGDLVLQRVRVIYSRAYLYFWFDVDSQ